MDAALLSSDHLLRGYAMGIFPMAQSRDDPQVHWLDPRQRGILPLDGFHISRSLAQRIRRAGWQVRAETDFEAVVRGCADREETWISDRILALYLDLHRRGFAHSIEVWDGPDLVGGVYGVVLGAAFFGESMFSAQSGGSKVALAYLVHRLRAGGFRLFDTQFLTPHLASLGAVEIPRAEYHRRLAEAIALPAQFDPPGYCASVSSVLSSGSSAASGGA